MSTTDPKDVAKSLNLLIIHTLLVERTRFVKASMGVAI